MQNWRSSLDVVAMRLSTLAATDSELRAHLRQLAEGILAATAEPQSAEAPPSVPDAVAARVPVEVSSLTSPAIGDETRFFTSAPPTAEVASLAPEPPLPSPSRPPAPDDWMFGPSVADSDLPLLEARCRLKAEGARWAAKRQRMLQDRADFRSQIEPFDRDIIERAKALPDCFLWMCSPQAPTPADLSEWEQIASCFETLENAVIVARGLVADSIGQRDAFEQALHLVAEAQSTLKVAIDRIDGGTDRDQLRIYNWLRATAAKQQIFITRFMRMDDSADPAALASLDARIEQLDSALTSARTKDKKRRSLFKRIHYHLNRMTEQGDTDHDWRRIIGAVDELVADGLPPSNRDLRDLLAPVIEGMPDVGDLSPSFQAVLRELERYLESRPSTGTEGRTAPPSEDVLKVAELLRGKAVVLIGGIRRRHAHEALKSAFDLLDLYWIEVPEHESITRFEPYVARPEVAVVIQAIRWSSHSYSGVSHYCDQHGKCFVRLRAGYNPNQVAKQILSQCGNRLGHAG